MTPQNAPASNVTEAGPSVTDQEAGPVTTSLNKRLWQPQATWRKCNSKGLF